MAAKRTAANELTHDNWDDEYEHEEAGTFKRAPADVIKNRVIKTARRRNPISSNNDSAKNVFSGFDGFKKAPTDNNQMKNNTPFTFTSLVTTKGDTNTFGLFKNITPSTNTATIPSTTGATSPFKIPEIPANITTTFTNKEKLELNDNITSYYAKLKGLNESVLDWIKTHVEKNPFILLSPIFDDYEKHLKEIEKESGTERSEAGNKSLLSSPGKSSAHSASIFGNLSNKSSESNFLSTSSQDKVQEKSTDFTPSETSTTSFSFGSKNTNSTSGFSFGAGKPFTFANVSRPESSETIPVADTQTQAQDDEDEPPKVEFTPVVEDGCIFQKRCKVFVKKDAQYSNRGVGQLFLKPVEGSEKVQLIVRADTSLGNLLLNFILNSSVPLQRMGTNNVMLVSIPTPDCKPPPVPILLRVKTAEEADDLLKVLQEHSRK